MASRPHIVVIGGPNLNLLGHREPAVYGRISWDELKAMCSGWADELGFSLDFLQSNIEGEIVDMLQAAAQADGVVLNAAAYSHTSVAIRDAVAALLIPVVEVHLTNPASREDFRRQDLLEDVVTAGIRGFGVQGYRLALQGLARIIQEGT